MKKTVCYNLRGTERDFMTSMNIQHSGSCNHDLTLWRVGILNFSLEQLYHSLQFGSHFHYVYLIALFTLFHHHFILTSCMLKPEFCAPTFSTLHFHFSGIVVTIYLHIYTHTHTYWLEKNLSLVKGTNKFYSSITVNFSFNTFMFDNFTNST